MVQSPFVVFNKLPVRAGMPPTNPTAQGLRIVELGGMIVRGDIMKRVLRDLALAVFCVVLFAVTVSAHSGNTDAQGGHYDHSTGEYHYHHGFPAHYHVDLDGDGDIDCPYDFVDNTSSNSGTRSSNISGYNSGYDDGWDDGYEEGYDDGVDDGYEEGEDYGYDNGYEDGKSAMKSTIVNERKDASKSAYILSAIIGIPVVFFATSFLVGKARNRIEQQLESQIAKLRQELRQERNKNSLKAAGINPELLRNIPSGVTLTTRCIPVKGTASKDMPYGDYTIYTAKGGKKYHTKYRCCNATTPMHFFDLPETLEPCKNCVPTDMYPQPLPNWYLRLISASPQKNSGVEISHPQPTTNTSNAIGSSPSTGIKGLAYKGNSLFISFSSGKTYQFDNISENIWKEIRKASSREEYFLLHIDGKYPYQLIREE